MSDRLSVVIVGAGPTGLMMACELARHRIPFRIIDKNPKRTLTSNATWIQPRTLEILDTMDLSNSFVKLGHHCNAIHLHSRGKLSIHIPMNGIDSPYQFILMLPQSETERLLIEHLKELNIHIERPVELIDVTPHSNEVIITLRHANNTTENIHVDWLIACDGVSSTVREKCQIDFPGKNFPEQFMVADAQMDSFVSPNEIHMFFDKRTVFVVFPLGSNKYRIGANLHQSHPRKLFIEKEVREIVNERCHGLYDIHSVSWISPFWIHSKAIKQMRHGRIFFAGDAAHIHSPTIGQGMNFGMQDAYNLAWKLALVIQNKALHSLLDTYQLERYPVIKSKVKQAEQLTLMALFDNNFGQKLREFHDKIAQNKLKISKKIGNRLAELNIAYLNSPIIHYIDKTIIKKLKPGMRAPNVLMNKKHQLYNYFRNTQHNVLLFTGQVVEKNKLAKLLKLQRWINKAYPTLVKAHIVSNEEIIGINVIYDTDALIHKRYNVKTPAIYLIRPDTYIAYYSRKITHVGIVELLERYLHPKSDS